MFALNRLVFALNGLIKARVRARRGKVAKLQNIGQKSCRGRGFEDMCRPVLMGHRARAFLRGLTYPRGCWHAGMSGRGGGRGTTGESRTEARIAH